MQKQLLSSVLLSLVLAAPATAKEIKIPEGKPQVAMTIPDDWTVTFDETGLQAVSPQTDSFVYGKILKRPKDDPNKWVREILTKLQARGVVFKTDDAAPAAPTKPAAVATATPAQPAAAPGSDHPAPAATTAAPAITAAPGATSEAKPAPAHEAADTPATSPVSTSLPSLALLEGGGLATLPAKRPRFPFHALPYRDTSLKGVPVDVELLTFILPDKSMFFLMQESGQTDPRMTDIIDSVQPPQK